MKTLEEQIEIMKACADGKKIEMQSLVITGGKHDEDWKTCAGDVRFNWEICDYRIKTEPVRVGLGNEFFVGIQNDNIILIKLLSIPQVLSKERALNLAAWLYMLADEGDGKFEKIVKEERGE